MKLKLMIQNVQELNDPHAVNRIKNYYFSKFSSLDVLCFQEHKLRGQSLLDLKFKIWNQALFLSCEASVGYGHEVDQAGAGCGGLCIFISPKIQHLVHSHSVVNRNQAQWVMFKGVPGGDVAVANIYAPNSSQERIMLWRGLINCLPQGCRWILGGDWNAVEHVKDKSSRGGRIISEVEKFEFELLKAHLQVSDFFKNNQLIAYMWDNHRMDGHRVLARLDRFYLFSNLNGVADKHVTGYSIQGDAGHSDHLPVTCTVEFKQEKPKGARYKMNAAYLKDSEVVLSLNREWKSYPVHQSFFGKMRRILRWYKEMSIRKAKARRFREEELRARLSGAQERLHRDPLGLVVQEEVGRIKQELREYETWKVDGLNTR
jgi:exonuclease III